MARRKGRYDSWTNFFTSLGTNRDKRTHTSFMPGLTLDRSTISALYREDGLGKRIVDLPAREMTRRWFEVRGDDDGLLLQELETLQAQSKFNRAIRWARAFGGALMVVGADDSGDLAMPLDERSLRSIQFLHVFDRHRVTGMEYNSNPLSPEYGQPEKYFITPVGMNTSTSFTVHASRCLRFDGEDVPDDIRVSQMGWGDSIFQAVFGPLRGVNSAYSSSELILEDFVQGVLTIDGLGNLLATDEGREQLVTRLEMMDLSRHVANTAILDTEETYQKHSSTVTGLADLVDRFMKYLSAVTGIPVTLLWGQSPAGLNATGENDVRNWYDDVAGRQPEVLGQPLERLLRLIMVSKDGPFRGRELEEWSVDYLPLWEPSEKEEAERRKLVAETDSIYLTQGVLEPEEVSASRFGGDTYSANTELMYERTAANITDREEGEEARRQAMQAALTKSPDDKGDDDDDPPPAPVTEA